jgi:hypothetical protein
VAGRRSEQTRREISTSNPSTSKSAATRVAATARGQHRQTTSHDDTTRAYWKNKTRHDHSAAKQKSVRIEMSPPATRRKPHRNAESERSREIEGEPQGEP